MDNPERQRKIIDQFIDNLPNITSEQNKDHQPSILAKDLYEKSVDENAFTGTETIAKILIKQGKLERAIQIYEQLKLKYPEKKAYFADQIEKLNTER